MSSPATVESPSHWLLETLKQLERLSQLPPDWDSYGAEPVKPEILGTSMRLLGAIDRADLPVPHVSAGSSGTVQLEWQIRGRSLELEIVDDETAEYLKLGQDGSAEEGEIPVRSARQLRDLVSWALAAPPAPEVSWAPTAEKAEEGTPTCPKCGQQSDTDS